MEAKITAAELKLLVWLHEHTKMFGEAGAMYTGNIAKILDIPLDDLWRQASYLAGHLLVGISIQDRTSYGSEGPEFDITSVWLTSLGENYIRVLESKPGIAQRLTIKTLKKIEDVAVKIAGTVLSEVIKDQMQKH